MDPKKLRIIFLDLDGVLNNSETLGENPLDPTSIGLLNELVRDTDACIVISSSWRIGNTLNLIQLMLKIGGFKYTEKIIGATSDLATVSEGGIWVAKTRGSEISLWLDQVPVDSFVILDDDNDMDQLMYHLVQTDFKNGGLLREHIEKAKKILTSNIDNE
jgi:hypothetical protein